MLFDYFQGELYAFGSSYFGQLGLGTNAKHTVPVKVTNLPDRVIIMATKYFHSVSTEVVLKAFN